MLLLFYLFEFGGSLCFLIWKSLCGSHRVCPECLNEVVGVLTPPMAGLGSYWFAFGFLTTRCSAPWPSSRGDLLAVCRLGCCSAPFLKITSSVPHPWPPWLHARPRAEPLVFILFQLEASLPHCLCCSGLGPCVDWGWYWVDVGLTVFPYWLGSRTPAALVRALPDFWWHCSRRFLGCFFFFFRGSIFPSPGYWVSSGRLWSWGQSSEDLANMRDKFQGEWGRDPGGWPYNVKYQMLPLLLAQSLPIV